MMMKRLIVSLFALLLLDGTALARTFKDGDSLKMARRITGYFEKGDCLEKQTAPQWDPMNDEDRQYVGPTVAKPGKWFELKNELPKEVGSEDDLKQLVYFMAGRLIPESPIKTSCGVSAKVLRKWLARINTSLYGSYELTEENDELGLKASYTPEARIMAAYRNPGVEGSLTDEEKKVLNTCADWIADNITENMPNGLKLKKVHDALVDNSSYTKGCHKAAQLILEGKGVCSAYAAATQLLLHMVKIDCRLVMGTKKMNHVWNLVELNEEWYHMDVTWDDPKGSGDMRMYNYYLLTDVEMDADHDWINPENFEKTPQVNPWHFPVRNDMRRSWAKGSSGYTLPREEEPVEQSMYNMYLKEASNRGEQFSTMLGLDVQRKEKAEDKLKMGEGSDPADVAKHWLKYKPKVTRLKKGDEKKDGVSDYREFNEQIEAHANELAGPRLVIKCKKDMDGWKMREMVGKSDINVYAQKYNAIYDEKKSTITLDIEYWPQVRLLTAANNDDARKKLTAAERRALGTIEQWVETAPIQMVKSKRRHVKGAHMGVVNHAKVKDEPSALCEMVNERASQSVGYAQALYVTLNLMDIPCIMVHGRTKARDHVWNMVRVNKREWYHVDSAQDDIDGKKSERELKYCMVRDDEVKEDHAWDREEIPPTPTKQEKEMLKKFNPFSGRF